MASPRIHNGEKSIFRTQYPNHYKNGERWDLRFGLYELDLSTGERRARPSAGLYAAIARANALRQGMAPVS